LDRVFWTLVFLVAITVSTFNTCFDRLNMIDAINASKAAATERRESCSSYHHIFVYLEVDKRNSYKVNKYEK